MGARAARMLRNFNLENRVHREISKEKPRVAPRHRVTAASSTGSSGAVDVVSEKNEPLLNLLQSVYVESSDPAAVQTSKAMTVGNEAARRPLKFNLPVNVYGLTEVKDVPKGKLTITEALKALSSHQRHPEAWTPEKIAQEYCLDLKDTKALLEFFIPFQVQIIPPKTGKTKQIKSS